jgi:hypothetical protein
MGSSPQHTPRTSNIKIVSICQPGWRGWGEKQRAVRSGLRMRSYRPLRNAVKRGFSASEEINR